MFKEAMQNKEPMKNQKTKRRRPSDDPTKLSNFFLAQSGLLILVTITGILYNLGMIAGPWFEGQLAQCFADIVHGIKTASDMVHLSIFYVAVIGFVQAMRYFKRLYVRKFANNVRLDMKDILYQNLVHLSRRQIDHEKTGELMTKAITDVDACAEGMRKFTTEIFDTGVAMAAYVVMLFSYDVRLTFIVLCFPPIAYFIAEKMKVVVARTTAESRASADRLNSTTYDRITNAVTYRIYGCENERSEKYEAALSDYEEKAVRANIWENTMEPLYRVIAMTGVVFIMYFGGKNVLGTGWKVWNIAAFTTYLTCFTKLSVKSSHAAKLFNAVQKAEISWKRIRPFMHKVEEFPETGMAEPSELTAENLAFVYPEVDLETASGHVFSGVNFTAEPGEIIGVTGKIASGKSTFGKVFLNEYPYEGRLSFGGREFSDSGSLLRPAVVGYLGHDPELFSDTIDENIRLGKTGDIRPVLKAVCMDQEVSEFPDGVDTVIGEGGVRLSGGQQARIALARTLFHPRPIFILDDPFSAVDQKTEAEIFKTLKRDYNDGIIFLISHRLSLFPMADQVIWMGGNATEVSDHKKLLEENPEYRRLWELQCRGDNDDD